MRHVALVLALFGVSPASAFAQAAPVESAAQPAVFRSAVSLVALNVTVTGPQGAVTDLQKGDFAVFEDGVAQPIEFFEGRHVPLDLILLLDTSSSIRDRMPVVHAAATGFMKRLRPGDRGAVVTFGDRVTIAQALTSDQAALETAILGTKAFGGTSLYTAVYIALRQFGRGVRDTGAVRRQAFAILSDGEDTSSLLAFEEVLAQARRSGVTIYTIHLRSGVEAPTSRLAKQASDSEYAMRRLAEDTGGHTFVAAHAGMLGEISNGIAQELATQYSIGYAPTNATPDGRFRRVTVRVVERPDLRLRARSGYLAEGQVVAGRR